jgi:hypothetical protein
MLLEFGESGGESLQSIIFEKFFLTNIPKRTD